jgi:hypothetical protein
MFFFSCILNLNYFQFDLVFFFYHYLVAFPITRIKFICHYRDDFALIKYHFHNSQQTA